MSSIPQKQPSHCTKYLNIVWTRIVHSLANTTHACFEMANRFFLKVMQFFSRNLEYFHLVTLLLINLSYCSCSLESITFCRAKQRGLGPSAKSRMPNSYFTRVPNFVIFRFVKKYYHCQIKLIGK